MGIMVYSLEWVMQDFVHQQYEGNPLDSYKSAYSYGYNPVPKQLLQKNRIPSFCCLSGHVLSTLV